MINLMMGLPKRRALRSSAWQAAKELKGDAKAAGDALSAKVLEDLKRLDQLAKCAQDPGIDPGVHPPRITSKSLG